MSKIEEFLLDEKMNDQVFETSYKNIKLHKEKFDDRFTIIYSKSDNGGFLQSSYNIAGYFDKKENVLYDVIFDLQRLIPDDTSISCKSFEKIDNEFINEVKKYIENYSYENQNELKSLTEDKYLQKLDWRINNYKSDVRKIFIKSDDPEIKLNEFYNISLIRNSEDFYSKNHIIQYLNHKDNTISKYANIIIDKCKEDLGLSLHLYEDKIKFINIIKKNNNNEFKDLYVNKNIYNAIKDKDMRSVNITIKYGNNEMTFKYDCETLKRDLLNDYRGSSSYGIAYDRVSDFIKNNKPDLESNRYKQDFDFSNIKSITHGKNELYKNDSLDKNKKSKEYER